MREIDIVGKHDHLALRGFLRQALGHPFSAAMIEGRYWVIEHDSAFTTDQTNLREEGADRNSALFPLTQYVAGTATLRQFELQLVQGLALVRAAL